MVYRSSIRGIREGTINRVNQTVLYRERIRGYCIRGCVDHSPACTNVPPLGRAVGVAVADTYTTVYRPPPAAIGPALPSGQYTSAPPQGYCLEEVDP